MKKITVSAAIGAAACLLVSATASAQEVKEQRRTRVALGAQAVPSYPGADDVSIRPMFDISRAYGDDPFEFEAPDEGAGFALLRSGDRRLSGGPVISFEGSRKAKDVGANLPKVGFTVEVGAFADYYVAENFRIRGEVLQGIGGHKGLAANLGGDFVARNGDEWLFSVGPRVRIVNNKYNRAYFSVAPEDSIPSGLPAYDAKGGLQAVGLAAGYLADFSGPWGVYVYAKYDRLVGDAADSPIVRRFGSRDQFAGGLALTYEFGGL